jgi:hypothetical protein
MKNKLLLALLSIALVSQSVFAAKGGKPPPEPVPASDVDCIGCVDTGDIADGAVTYQELPPVVVDDFNQLDSRVSEQELRRDIVAVDGNGDVIGRIIGDGHNKGQLHILSGTGYDAFVNRYSGSIVDVPIYLYYTSRGCSGVAISIDYPPGVVHNQSKIGGIFYSPKDAVTHTYNSGYLNNGACQSTTSNHTGYEVLPNDPAVTGFPDEGYLGPILVEYQ